MTNIAGHWVGDVNGTNIGNLYLNVLQEGAQITGDARIADRQFGLAVYSIDGTATNEAITFQILPTDAEIGVNTSAGSVTANLAPDGSLHGTWETEIGSAGTFQAVRREPRTTRTEQSSYEPPQLFNRALQIGAVRMFRNDISKLVEIIRRDFVVGQPVVTYLRHGNEVTEFADNFLSTAHHSDRLEGLKLTVQETEPSGMTKSAAVELYRNGGNVVRAAGTSETWVIGKASTLFTETRRSEKKLFTSYVKYGLNLNLLLLIVLLAVIPELTVWNRVAFAVGVVFLQWLHFRVHQHYIPSTIVDMGDASPTLYQKFGAAAFSWLLTVLSAVAASALFWFLFERSQ